MSKKITVCFVLIAGFIIRVSAQQHHQLEVNEYNKGNSFKLFSVASVSSIMLDPKDAKVVSIASTAFVKDVELVCGKQMKIDTGKLYTSPTVIAGTIGQSKWIDDLVKSKLLDVSAIRNKWECFIIKVISPTKLVIAGSDPRGTAFGIFHLSKLLGVSPWVWWADAIPAKKTQIFISGSYISHEPSVKYRGIFLNDEDWGLQPWAAKTFEPETGDIGPKTYAKVFELLLRLKANLIWPAMHPCTKPFFTVPGNKKIAEDYAIIIGTSHAEPMLRNNVGEWDEKTMGQFNYTSNKERVLEYWNERVKESRNLNAIYTIGMRGVHDSKMEGVKDAKDAVPILEDIFKDQRKMLADCINKAVTQIPQAFTAYKEVLEIYDHGLKVPEDVTLVWPDDNYGYIERLNNEEEEKRSGGSGVYYHASYWGRPHDYLWLSGTHPALMQEEMMKAYNNGSRRLWVLNVGDIKPLEYNIQMFLDMAYNAKPFEKNDFAKQHLFNWTASLFGKEKAKVIQPVLWQYYHLAYERRPEFMGWDQTEPITETGYTTFNHFYYGDEAQKRIDCYQDLENKVKNLRGQMAPKNAAAFYQLIYYPVVGASLMNKKFLYRDKSYFYGKQNRLSSLDYAKQSKGAYDSIVSETNYFNNQLSGGKWKYMMSMEPRKLPVFLPPELQSVSMDTASVWDVAPEGFVTKDSSLPGSGTQLHLPSFDNLNKQQYFIDVFLTANQTVNWKASVAPWIKLSTTKGILTPVAGKNQIRLCVTVDWNKIPLKSSSNGKIIFESGDRQIPVAVSARKLEVGNFKGFIENNGYVSIYPVHYSVLKKQKYSDWNILPGLGYTGNGLISKEVPVEHKNNLNDTSWIKKNSSYVEYDFYTLSPADASVTVFTVPTHPLNNLYSMRYGVAVDNGPLKLVDFKTYGRSEEWKQDVLRNRAQKTIKLFSLYKGKHALRIYAIDPGVILDGMLIDLGGLKTAYGPIDETVIRK